MKGQRRLGLTAAFGILVVMGAAAPALAATAGLSDANLTSSNWTHYGTARTSSLATISYDPAENESDGSLLYQTSNVWAFNMKLRNYPSGTDLSTSQNWNNYRSAKNLISGLAVGTRFTVSACCRYPGSSDTYWSGTLNY